MGSSLSGHDAEAALHMAMIEALAAEMNRPVDVVERTYLAELERLSQGARIHDYLPLFTARRTRELLNPH